MLNQVVIVGRLVEDLEPQKTGGGKNFGKITLAVPRSFKNMDGEYETDFLDCILWDNVALNTAEYCKKGDIIGVKGRMQSRSKEIDGKNFFLMEIVAEKVTFLSSRNHEQSSKNTREDESR